MTTSNTVAAASTLNIGSFDPNQFVSYMTTDRCFTIDLSRHSLIGVMEAYEEHTQKKHGSTYTNSPVRIAVENLQKYLNGQVIMPINVTSEFYTFLISFLYSGKNGRVLKPSTVELYLNQIRTALNFAAKHNCTVSETYQDFKIDNYEASQIALTVEDIAVIDSFDIEMYKERIKSLLGKGDGLHNIARFSFTLLQKVKDHFVLSCNLGQRISDSKRIDPYMFDETGTIFKVTQQKTGGKATVYLPKYSVTKKIALKILKKYGYKAPAYGINTGNYNKYLHLLMHAIGGDFLEVVRSQNKINGQIVTEEKQKWQMISSHTARRTFITNMERNGFSLSQIAKCSGHKDYRVIQRYIKTADDE